MKEKTMLSGKEKIISHVVDGLRLTLFHYGLWFKEKEVEIYPPMSFGTRRITSRQNRLRQDKECDNVTDISRMSCSYYEVTKWNIKV